MPIKTYRDIIKVIGYDNFVKYGTGWYNIDYMLSNTNMLDYRIDRYALYGILPFCLLNQAYNEEYQDDNNIGSTYDWLGHQPEEDEITDFFKKYPMEVWLKYFN